MKEEIKEILDKLKKKEEIYLFQIKNKTSFNSDEYEAHLLLDYITTLQGENKEAHDSDKTMKDIKEGLIARINRQDCEIHNLKARIDKALEYIDENYLDVSYTYEKGEKLKCIVLDKIKEILKGDSSNE